MATITAKLTSEVEGLPVELVIKATVRELRDYNKHNDSPSHSVAYRIHDAVSNVLRKLDTSITEEVVQK